MTKTFLSRFLYKKVPQFLSAVFHPLMMPTLGIFIILHSGTYLSLMPETGKNIILLVVVTCTFGLPLAFIPVFLYRKMITSIEVTEKQERIIPLVITTLFYYFAFYLLRRMGAPGLIQAFLLASTVVVFINLVVNTLWKISAHMMGIGGVCGMVIVMLFAYRADMMVFLMILVLLGGVIGFARLSLNAHSPAQVYVGFATGFLVMVMTLFMF